MTSLKLRFLPGSVYKASIVSITAAISPRVPKKTEFLIIMSKSLTKIIALGETFSKSSLNKNHTMTGKLRY